MLKLFSLIETRQIQAKIIACFRVFAIFAFPSLVRSMRIWAAIADNFILCYSATALWKQICKFFNHKSVSDGDTKGNTEGRKYAVRRGCSVK